MTPTWPTILCVVPKRAQVSVGSCSLRFTTPNPSGSWMAKLQPLPTPLGILSSPKSGNGKGAPSSLITPHVSHLSQVQ